MGIGVGSAKVEAIVHKGVFSSKLLAFCQCFQCGCLWHHVGHIHDGGDTTGSSRMALCCEIAFMGHPRLTGVNVVVDNAGKE